jgi:Zn-dependent peptidase ImmA (M78 family)
VDAEGDVWVNVTNDEPVEHREANAFAMALLMPADWLRREVAEMGGFDPTDETAARKMAQRYGVSPIMLAFRIGMLFGQKVGKQHP